jgi:hypothetical protein
VFAANENFDHAAPNQSSGTKRKMENMWNTLQIYPISEFFQIQLSATLTAQLKSRPHHHCQILTHFLQF